MLMKLLGDDPARWREFMPDFDYEPRIPDGGEDPQKTKPAKAKRAEGKKDSKPRLFSIGGFINFQTKVNSYR